MTATGTTTAFKALLLGSTLLLLLTRAANSQPKPPPPNEPGPNAEQKDRRRIEELEKKVASQNRNIKELVETLDEVSANQVIRKSEREVFTLHGFFDLNLFTTWFQDDAIAQDVIENTPSFMFGNLNTYYDFDLGESWRVLAEIRLLLHPAGEVLQYENPLAGTSFERVHTTSYDGMQFGSTFDRGSIEIERAQVEWKPRDWFNLTVGLFLTPFGIWNIDHGSPARLTGMIPYIYSGQFGSFPERQLGIMVSGHAFIDKLNLEYALTVSNGRGPASTLRDHDKDKAIGGRIAVSGVGAVRWKTGLSFYTGRFSDYTIKMEFSPEFDIKKEFTTGGRETAVGADLRLDYGPLTLHGEGLVMWTFYEDDKRPPVILGDPTSGLAADFLAWGFYGAAGYRLPLAAVSLQPFVRLGLADGNDALEYRRVLDLSAGINWHVTSNVVWRAEYSLFHFLEVGPSGKPHLFESPGTIHMLLTQLAVAFSS